MKCLKCKRENTPYLTQCKYCGNRFNSLDNTKKELKYCECGCPVPLKDGKGYCVNCKEEVYSFELF